MELSSLAAHSAQPTLSLSFNGSSLTAINQSKAAQPTSFLTWLNSFLVYASTYVDRYPQAATNLYTYIKRVSDIERSYEFLGENMIANSGS